VDVAELGAHLHTSVVIKKELKSFETKVKECQDEIDTIQDQEQALQEKVPHFFSPVPSLVFPSSPSVSL
jgi:predicted phage-related endonuclease